mgnify:CR=1 FL=1
MLRKWSDQAVVWTEYGQYLFSQNKLEPGRNLLQRALKTLPSKLRKNNLKYLILLFFHIWLTPVLWMALPATIIISRANKHKSTRMMLMTVK